MNRDGLRIHSPALGILGKPLAWPPSPRPPPHCSLTSFTRSTLQYLQVYFQTSDVGEHRVQPGCCGHSVKAYLMHPVASISLGMNCEVTAHLRHQRRWSYVQAYSMEGWNGGSFWRCLDKDYMEVILREELFSMV